VVERFRHGSGGIQPAFEYRRRGLPMLPDRGPAAVVAPQNVEDRPTPLFGRHEAAIPMDRNSGFEIPEFSQDITFFFAPRDTLQQPARCYGIGCEHDVIEREGLAGGIGHLKSRGVLANALNPPAGTHIDSLYLSADCGHIRG